jgi:hypothetical protein
MHDHERKAFTDFWAASWELVGRNITPRALLLVFDSLKAYPLEHIKQAVLLHQQGPRGRNPPTIADVVEAIGGHSGTPSADEAWTIACDAMDEALTVLWTEPMQEAWGRAKSVYDTGDEVGARMAFRAIYEKAVALMRAQGIKPTWTLTLGTNPTHRQFVVEDGIKRGLLPRETAQTLGLPAPTPNPINTITGLIEHADQVAKQETEDEKRARILAALAGLKNMLAGPNEDELAARREAKRLESERKRNEQLARLAELGERWQAEQQPTEVEPERMEA